MASEDLLHVLRTLAAFCAARGVTAWLVGGAARDLALGQAPADLDVAVDADGVALARAFANQIGGAFVALDDERGTGRAICPLAGGARLVVDLVQLRAPSLEQDLRLRDFTINALAIPLDERLALAQARAHLHTPGSHALIANLQSLVIDPCGGLADLAGRRLRPCGPGSLRDDPLRVLRAARLAAALGLAISPELDAAMRASAPLIGAVAGERVRDELMKLLALPRAAPMLRYLDDVRALTRIIPELEPARDCDQPRIHFLPVLGHSLEAVLCAEWLLNELQIADCRLQITSSLPQAAIPAAVAAHPDLSRELPFAERLRAHFAVSPGGAQPRAALLKLAVLLHDNAKPQTKEHKEDGSVTFYGHQEIGAEVAAVVLRRLRMSRQEIAYVGLVVREHMRPGQLRSADELTRRAAVRFFRDTGDAGPDVLLHDLADHLAVRGPHITAAAWGAHLAWMAAMLDVYWGEQPVRPVPLVNGNDIMAALGIGPGPAVGRVLREIQEAQASGEISSRAEALELAQRLAGG